MKTNQILKSEDRKLFGTVIKQQTKNGQMLSVTDLQKAYEFARFQNGWSVRRIADIMKSKDFQERCYYILKERNIINTNIVVFMDMIENEGVTKVLKGLKVYKTTGRGAERSTYADPYIWVLLALELNPEIYAKVVLWLTDSLILNRNDAGSKFNEMNRAISSIVTKPKYSEYARAINEKVFGFHQRQIRNFATSAQLKAIHDIENIIQQGIDIGFIKNENQILYTIKNFVLPY